MSISDQEFREQFKPLHIPSHYNPADTDQDKIIFALAELGKGNIEAIVAELKTLDETVDTAYYHKAANNILNRLFNKGLIKGDEINGQTVYNLSKITQANDGEVDPDLLAPGLD